MRLIGLCGRSGSGKSVFCEAARTCGIRVIDCDAVYREMVSKPSLCLSELESAFGSEVIENNSLNRKKLASIVFSDPEKLALLNSITHKHIKNEIGNILETFEENDTVIFDAPTLFESGLDSVCESVIGIVSSDSVCVERIMSRDNISESEAKARLANQLSVEYIVENCDIIIYNDSSLSNYEASSRETAISLKEGRL